MDTKPWVQLAIIICTKLTYGKRLLDKRKLLKLYAYYIHIIGPTATVFKARMSIIVEQYNLIYINVHMYVALVILKTFTASLGHDKSYIQSENSLDA